MQPLGVGCVPSLDPSDRRPLEYVLADVISHAVQKGAYWTSSRVLWCLGLQRPCVRDPGFRLP
eukprot:11196179-Lingulodinium_polyedra.AAC.1